MNIQYGTMKHRVTLAGVLGMALEAGQRVRLVEPTNLPASENIRWFATPEDGKWSDGVPRNRQDSILIDHDDVEVDEEHVPHPSQQLCCFV